VHVDLLLRRYSTVDSRLLKPLYCCAWCVYSSICWYLAVAVHREPHSSCPQLPRTKDYSVDEVCMWLGYIGLGGEAPQFRENAVDADMLVTLTKEDMTGDLALSNLQAKKVLRSLEFQNNLSAVDCGGADPAAIAALEADNAALKKENDDLKAQIAALTPIGCSCTGSCRCPSPEKEGARCRQGRCQRYCQRSRSRCRVSIAYLLFVTNDSAMMMAITHSLCHFSFSSAGAVSGKGAAQGAKTGAAVGATAGGMHGLGARHARRHMG